MIGDVSPRCQAGDHEPSSGPRPYVCGCPGPRLVKGRRGVLGVAGCGCWCHDARREELASEADAANTAAGAVS